MPDTESATFATEPIRLSVIIPCYNDEQTIGEQLEALAEQVWSEPWEVIVANNRCTDGSIAVVERYRGRVPNLRIVDALGRQAQPHAMNAGVRAARGDLIAFCDADDVVAPGWVAAIAKALSEYELVAGPHDLDRLNTSSLTKGLGRGQRPGVKKYSYPPYLDHAGSGNMGVRRSVLERVGLFDESMKACFDTDLCFRAQLAGISLQPAPDAVLYVRQRESMMGLVRQARFYGEWNVFLYKLYRDRGMPKLHWKEGVRAWIGIALSSRAFLSRDRRAAWLWQLGWRYGRIVGSVKYRVVAL